MTLDPDLDLTFTRIIDAPRSVLWDCWTSPDHLRQFFIPKPHRVTDCKIDLRPGGRFNTVFDVDGTEMRNEGVFLEVTDGQRLVFTDAYTEGWRPAPEPFMTAIVAFEDECPGATRYTATARHRSAASRKRHEEMGFIEGWGTVASQLESYAKSL